MNRGFTLIELLVVIAIVAILAVVVVITINPAELLRQARDSNRISDLRTISSAISLYLADYPNPSMGSASNCYVHIAGLSAGCGGVVGTRTVASTTARTTDGNGWIPINFGVVSSGSPLGNLPVDPTNTTTYYYIYSPTASSTFELNANMESTRYIAQESSDGGDDAAWYETGSTLSL